MARRTTTLTNAHRLAIPIAATVALAAGSADAANPTYYDDLASFEFDVTDNITDDYSSPGYMDQQGNAQMNAVFGETDYFTTGFDDWNLVVNNGYCAGCNGSFELSFQTTTVGDATGVNGVGLLIVSADFMMPYFAFITFADGTTADIQLPAMGFWGVSAPERIERIHFGLSMGGATQAGYFQIDDLIIGDGFDETPCGDGIPTPDEECDDMGQSATCDANCTLAICGDGTFNPVAGELCDDGGPSPTCNADCTAPFCGDSLVNTFTGEECDDGGESLTCNADCSTAVCGDGQLNVTAGEICDDSAESPECDADCTLVVCGDGIENNTAGEYCDDNNNVDGDGCSATCVTEEIETTGEDESTSAAGSSEGTTAASTSTAGSDDVGETGETGTGGGDTSGGDASGGGTGGGSSEGANDSLSASATDADDESSGGTGSGGADDSGGGCGCSTEGDPRDAAWSVIALFGVGALVRRRRRG